MSTRPAHAPRKPGRPRSEHAPDSRQALIHAAHELFARHSFEEVSTKRIADAAGVNPAMIHYHFGGKTGLLHAAFRETLSPVISELTALSSQDSDGRFRRFFELYMRTLAANPWLPKLMVRHVLPDGGALQDIAVQEIGARVGPVVAQLVARSQASQELRSDLNPVLTTLSLVSLAVFPFLTLPVSQRVFGLKMDDRLVSALIEHSAQLFYHGAGSGDGDTGTPQPRAASRRSKRTARARANRR